MSAAVHVAAHYEVAKLENYEQTALACGLGVEAMLNGNWLFISTSGVHGSYGVPSDPDFFLAEDGTALDTAKLTVLIVRPRTVCMLYGHIEVTHEQGAALEAWAKKCAAYIADVHG